MKNYKLVDKTPYQAAGLGVIAGASMGAATVSGALIGAALGAGAGLVAGGVVAYRDAKGKRNSHFHDAASRARHDNLS